MKHITIASAVGVNVGMVRKNNEDNFYYNGLHLTRVNREIPAVYSERRDDAAQIFAVCDGMGGEAYGEEASLTAVETLVKYKDVLSSAEIHDIDKYVQMFLLEASNLIYEKSCAAGQRIGTTIAMLCAENGKIHIYNVGDSRVYRLHKNKLVQLTEDHTQAMRAFRMGSVKKKDLKTHPHRNKLTQYLGLSTAEMIIKPSIAESAAANNDKYLICSDGVTDMLEDSEIKRILKQNNSERDIVGELIEKAKDKGGRDNITAIVLKIEIDKKRLFSFSRKKNEAVKENVR